ncbi:MAG: hypothetical protein OCC49_17600 [Fibrobacterales bacterium]
MKVYLLAFCFCYLGCVFDKTEIAEISNSSSATIVDSFSSKVIVSSQTSVVSSSDIVIQVQSSHNAIGVSSEIQRHVSSSHKRSRVQTSASSTSDNSQSYTSNDFNKQINKHFPYVIRNMSSRYCEPYTFKIAEDSLIQIIGGKFQRGLDRLSDSLYRFYSIEFPEHYFDAVIHDSTINYINYFEESLIMDFSRSYPGCENESYKLRLGMIDDSLSYPQSTTEDPLKNKNSYIMLEPWGQSIRCSGIEERVNKMPSGKSRIQMVNDSTILIVDSENYADSIQRVIINNTYEYMDYYSGFMKIRFKYIPEAGCEPAEFESIIAVGSKLGEGERPYDISAYFEPTAQLTIDSCSEIAIDSLEDGCNVCTCSKIGIKVCTNFDCATENVVCTTIGNPQCGYDDSNEFYKVRKILVDRFDGNYEFDFDEGDFSGGYKSIGVNSVTSSNRIEKLSTGDFIALKNLIMHSDVTLEWEYGCDPHKSRCYDQHISKVSLVYNHDTIQGYYPDGTIKGLLFSEELTGFLDELINFEMNY